VPGPFSALLAATALRDGFAAGLKIAALPLLTETAVVVTTALFVSRLPDTALRWAGFAGGLFVLYLAKRIWDETRAGRAEQGEDAAGEDGTAVRDDSEDAEASDGEPAAEDETSRTDDEPDSVRPVLQGMVLAVASPAPWVFWLLVGSPLLLAAWREGWVQAAGFLGSFLIGLVGVHVLVAAIAGEGHERLSPLWRRRFMRAAAVALALGGGVLLWRASTGKVAAPVPGAEKLRSVGS
jgi:threonine/homoserine/homoserine lactone efflux protein